MNRIDAIRRVGVAQAYLLTSDVNVAYATGFTGDSSALLITEKQVCFFTDSRYTLQAQKDMARDVEIITTGAADRNSEIAKRLFDAAVEVLAVEQDSVTVREFADYKRDFACGEYVDASTALLRMRAVKTEDEIAKITKAAKANEMVLEELLKTLKIGMSEYDVRAELIYWINKQGMDSAFAPIVASGENSALPHATATNRKICDGDLLTLDFGCKYAGYCSDITRTFGFGNVDEESKKIYDIVKAAQEAALVAVKTEKRASVIDAVARDMIEQQGYGDYYKHGTGHGVGMQIHERPILNLSSVDILEKNMVYTIEPGIYIPGLGGVRIEDTCVAGIGNLYNFTKELILI